MASFTNAAATLPVSDIDRAKTFYGQTLGLSQTEENPGGVMYSVGAGMLFVYPSEFAGSNRATAASFETDDLEGAMSQLRSAGVSFEEYDMPGVKTENGIAEIGGDRGAWFSDPDGNILALVQRGTGS